MDAFWAQRQQQQHLVDILENEEPLKWHAIIPHGNSLASGCGPSCGGRSRWSNACLSCFFAVHPTRPWLSPGPFVRADRPPADASGIRFSSGDVLSNRLINIHLHPSDLLEFCLHRTPHGTFKCTLETSSIHAVFHQLFRRCPIGLHPPWLPKRKDTIVLYETVNGTVGCLVNTAAGECK